VECTLVRRVRDPLDIGVRQLI
jgi:hypothetical protein